MELLTIQLKKMFLENINNIFNGNFEDKIIIENSTKKEFGDFQTNFAMITSKILEKNPREIANTIIENFRKNDLIEKLEVAGPGFINIYLKNSFLNSSKVSANLLLPIRVRQLTKFAYSNLQFDAAKR